ncbi:MAG: T9SS type A sorting domain-containing protein [Saprospiraceae bacterium]
MIKQLHCLIPVFLLTFISYVPAATAAEDDFSGCCKPPLDVVYWCNDLPYDFNPYDIYQLQVLFGKPQNKCYANVWAELNPIVKLTNCETGTITRRFQVSAHYGYEYCEPTITIKGTHNYDIRFPADFEVSCGAAPPAEDLFTRESACDLLAVSVTDQTFSSSGSGCGKIFRKYKVINWCEYDGISDKVVIGRDEDCDGNAGDEDVWVLRRADGFAFIDRDDQEYNNNPKLNERGCAPKNPKGYWRKVVSTGYWEYTQHIKINDKIAPVVTVEQPSPFCSYNNNCDASTKISFTIWDDCTPNDIKSKIFINGVIVAEFRQGGEYFVTGTYKVGTHQVEIHASDGCGNSTVIKSSFQVVDCKAPAPICVNGITVTLMPTPANTDVNGDSIPDKAAMTISAKDLIISQVTDCSGIAGFSINRVGETPNINKTNLVLTCDDLGTLQVEIYAWDRANNPYAVQPDGKIGGRNRGVCQTYILVQENNNLCGGAAAILGSLAGAIKTEDGHYLNNIPVLLVNDDSTMQRTNTEGIYNFDSLQMHKRYRVVPSFNENWTEGITLADIVALQKHLLNSEIIQSPYRLIAADIDRSNSVTGADLIELRKLLLGITTQFEYNTSWRFINAQHVFINPVNPWEAPFPEYVEVPEMTEAISNGNFIGVKIGDVDGSIMSDRESASSSRLNVANILIQDQAIPSGAYLEIPIRVKDPLEAMLFNFNFDPTVLELVGIQYNIAKKENINMQHAQQGSIRVLWDPDLQTYSTNTLFTLQFRAQRAAQLREVFSLSEPDIPASAQQKDGSNTGLVLQWTDAQQAPVFALYPNAPNPFREETVLSFQLPQATSGTVRIYDLTGKLLWEQQSDFVQGYNQLIVTQKSLGAQGLLLYTLETPQHRATGRMVVLPE